MINSGLGFDIWNLVFYVFKSQEGIDVGFLLTNPQGKSSFISCEVEFECTNNTTKYESLLQCLNKSIDLKVKCL